MPVRRSSGYGYRQRPTMVRWHEGLDIAAPEGTPVYAVLAGRVLAAKTAGSAHFSGYGNVVVLEHDGGLWSLYAHMRRPPLVSTGELVAAGRQLGEVGGTESSQAQTIPVHLHHAWAVRPWPKHYDEASVNPELVLGTLGLLFDPPGLVSARAPGMPLENPTAAQREERMGGRSGRSHVAPSSRLACAPPQVATVPPLPVAPPVVAPPPPVLVVPGPADFRPSMPRTLQPAEVATTAGPLVAVVVTLGIGAVLTAGAKSALRASVIR